MTRSIPDLAVQFVAAHEGLRLTAYADVAGVWTVGYGHIDGVHEGMRITKAEALAFLRQDMQIAVRKLYSVLREPVILGLNDHQWSALLSFAFNVGAKASWTIWKVLNAGKLELVPGELMKFTRAGGQQIKGLVHRRADEVKLWSTPDPDEEHAAPPSAVTRQPAMTPPVTDAKPVAQSKTFWAGGTVAAAGVVQGAQQIQALAAPQAANSDLIAKLVGFASILIVAGGVAIMVFRWLDAHKARN